MTQTPMVTLAAPPFSSAAIASSPGFPICPRGDVHTNPGTPRDSRSGGDEETSMSRRDLNLSPWGSSRRLREERLVAGGGGFEFGVGTTGRDGTGREGSGAAPLLSNAGWCPLPSPRLVVYF
jgi:hypothetical protein